MRMKNATQMVVIRGFDMADGWFEQISEMRGEAARLNIEVLNVAALRTLGIILGNHITQGEWDTEKIEEWAEATISQILRIGKELSEEVAKGGVEGGTIGFVDFEEPT